MNDSSTAAWPDAAHDTVGSLLAHIATALQDTLRLLMFADKRGWGPDEFEQVRAVEVALDEARRDFQAMAPLVNGQFYYEGDRRAASLNELRALRADAHAHAQVFRDWLRTGGPINPLWARDTLALRRRLHRAQCRAARRIFNAEHQDADGAASGGRCLGAFLLYRRLRANADARQAYQAAVAATKQQVYGTAGTAGPTTTDPIWKQQQPRLHAREKRQSAGREPMTPSHGVSSGSSSTIGSNGQASGQANGPANGHPSRRRTVGFADSVDGSVDSSSDGFVMVDLPSQQTQGSRPKSVLEQRQRTSNTPNTAPDMAAQSSPPSLLPPSPPPLTLEDLVPDCRAVGTFERFGDYDIAFICDFCDGHIVWEDVQRLPTSRDPPPAVAPSDDAARRRAHAQQRASSGSGSLPLALKLQPLRPPTSTVPSPSHPTTTTNTTTTTTATTATTTDHPPDDDPDTYPRWQATTVAASHPDTPRTIVFAPLAVANHLPPAPGAWEARLWCPYCDDYLYFDSAVGDQTRYAQDEHGFDGLTDFQAHLEWHHTALPLPALPALPLPDIGALSTAAKDRCGVM